MRLLQGHLAVGFLTALVGLATVLTRTASERRRSIGVLRSIGASASTLRRAFVLEAVSFSVSGAAIGVLAAVLCVWRLLASGEFGRIARPPVEPRLLIMIFAGAVVAAIVAASLPARRATKASPASTLR